MKLALVTTPWSAASPVGEVTKLLVRYLADALAIDVYVERGREGPDYFGWSTRAADTLHPRDYGQVLFAIGDEAQHGFMAPMVRTLGGCVVLHDASLFHLATAAFPELSRGGWRGTLRALREGGLRQAREYRTASRSGPEGGPFEPHAACEPLAMHRSIVRFADSFLVHSEAMRRRILDDRNAPTPIGVLPYGTDASGHDADRPAERVALGVAPEVARGFWVTTLEPASAQFELCAHAVALARRSGADVHWIAIGNQPGRTIASAPESRDCIHVTGTVSRDVALRWIRAGDMALQLRGASLSATLPAIASALGCGRGVIASDCEDERELPSSCVQRVGDDASALASLLTALASDGQRRASMEVAARAYVERVGRSDLVAAKAIEFLSAFPPPRSARKSLIAVHLARARESARA